MEKQALINLARQTARQYQIDEALVCAVCEQESEWDPWAARPEPEFELRYEEPLKKLTPQQHWLRSTSFGLMQIMGQTAREFGFALPFETELCDPQVGLMFGCKKLKRCLVLKTYNVEAALETYNGGSNPNYAKEVLARTKNYSQDQNANGSAAGSV